MNPKDIPDHILDDYRDIAVSDSGWWRDVCEDFVDEQCQNGVSIDIDDIEFSGFWSQGDGASFTGYVIDDLAGFITRFLDPNDYPFTILLCEHDPSWEFQLFRISHHHCHSNTVSAVLVIQDDLDLVYDPEHPMVAPHWEQWVAQFWKELEVLEEDMLQVFRGMMDDLYQRLKDEHDYLTSDEYVRALLESNPEIWKSEAA